MTRNYINTLNKIALLATGDEVVNGDILNSNSQVIAQKLFTHGMQVGLHMSVSDSLSDIEACIQYLLQSHRALIITGGLGPTSDDITRYALAKALNRSLVFSPETWEAICSRFKTLGYQGEPPESNRQQALFPEDAIIIANPNGTAAGCAVQQEAQFIFMLPGPPFECLPMVDTFVLPLLKQQYFQNILFYDHWLLFGVSESVIAAQLDHIAKPFDCVTGYRLAYPYIEFKIYSKNEKDFKTLQGLIEPAVKPYLISDGKQTASALLQKQLAELNFVLTLRDTATGGLLENTIKTPKTAQHLNFNATDPVIDISGLTAYWSNTEDSETSLYLQMNNKKLTYSIPLRGRAHRVKLYAVEYLCQQISHYLSTS